ncbi:LytR/AlgR family response regulator transcription factor [Sphingomonas fennica]|uniref:DNA-binding response regulator n=1 Tax=Edaphosphingomonas fennica TaxID=114404 RepID=A0A2T4HZU7_9SPHN|nr:LytTR family DNA-binding domain-containing protein [Sphingomonas fennica]PTD22020.1 DNA-binding response regulator [Sphingomonas fennica]
MAADTAPERALRTLIVDDEPLAIERLQILCAQTDGIDLVGTASDGEAALRLVEALKPDLLLCDIAMPGLDGMGVAQALEKQADRPAIIFCTAFDQFAVAAFDVAAVDYLLKPVSGERLSKAVARVHDKLRQPPTEKPQPTGWTEEFWVPHRSEMIRVAAADIDRIEAERDYMRLHIGQRSFLLHQTISELERRLDPNRFIRLHRSTIVRRDHIAKLRHDGLGVWHADLADGTEVRIGRTYLQAAKAITGR